MTERSNLWFKVILMTVSFFTTFFIWGVLFTFTVYSEALSKAFDISFTQTSGIFSITLLTFFTSLGVCGVLLTRIQVRRVLGTMTILSGVAVGAMQVTSSFPALLGIYLAFGTAFGALFVSVLALVPQWFDRWGSLALGVVVSGNGIGALVMPFVWRNGIASVGIRRTFLFVGAALVLTHGAASFVLQRPDSVAEEADESTSETAVTVEWFRQLTTHPRFPFAFAGMGLSWAWYYMLSGHLVTILTRADINAAVATGAFGLIGGVSIITRILSGLSADYVDGRTVFVATLSVAALGSLALLYRDNLVAVYIAVTLFGVGLGGIATLTSPVLLDSYGTENGTAIIGVFNLAAGVAGFIAPSIPTVVFGGPSDYTSTIIVVAVLTALGGILFWYGTGTEQYQTA